jgi:hypothetical protein
VNREENRAILRRFYDEVISNGNLSTIDEPDTLNLVDHNPSPGQGPNREGLKQPFRVLLAAFPDMRITVDNLLA